MAVPQATVATGALEASLAAEATATATAAKEFAIGVGQGGIVVFLTARIWYLLDQAVALTGRSNIVSPEQEQESLKGESAAKAIKTGFGSGLQSLSKVDASAKPISNISIKPEVQHKVDPFSGFGLGNFPSIQQSQKPKAPELPPRRLSANAQPKQSSSNPPSVQPVNAWLPATTTVQSAGKIEYGQLLHNPVSATKVNVPVYDTKEIQKSLQARQKANIKEFTNYVSSASATMPLENINILNIDLPDAKGKIQPTQIVGASVTKGIAQQYHERSKAATQFPTMSTAPLQIGATVVAVGATVGLAANPAVRGAATNAARGAAVQARNLGSKIPTEFNKLKAALDLSQLMQIVTMAGVVHNAAMLSNDLLGSCMQVVNNAMALVGIKNTDGSAFDTKQIIGKKVEEFVIGIVGAKTVADTKRKFAAFNSVYTSVTNAYNNIANLQQSMVNVLEVGSSYTGRIGNALMRHNVLPTSSYKWMDENVEVENKRLNRLTNALASSTQIASDFAQITGDLVSVKDSIAQLQADKTAIVKSVTDAEKVFTTDDANRDKASNPPIIKPEDE